jgi:UDP-N-acetylglucosamine 2-epimerase (non-hydrolysing)
MNMPKEVNRLVIDALSDYLFTAGVKSNSVATREQSEGSSTYMVGNILMDTLRFNHQRFTPPSSIHHLPSTYLVFTINRKALLADEGNLKLMLEAMMKAANGTPIIAILREKTRETVTRLTNDSPLITYHSSLPYLEFGWLTAHARGIITDSGNVAEEATFNGVPCITLNSYTEHQETVTVGSNVLVGEDPQRLAEEVTRMVSGSWKKSALPERWDGRTAERIVQILLG